MEKVTPITPEECNKKRLPDFVIKAANNCIKRNYYNGYSKFYLTELFDEIIRTSTDKDFEENTTLDVCFKNLTENGNKQKKRHLIIANNWNLLAETYSKIGWDVKLNSPAYDRNDSTIYYSFSAKKYEKEI